MANSQYLITDGPSKFDFMLAVFDGKPITFTLDGLGTKEARLSGATAKNPDSREVWLVTGSILLAHEVPCEGEFNCRTRQGTLTIPNEDSDTEAQKPKDGDRAYTRYHGQRYEGVLDKMDFGFHGDCRGTGALVPSDGSNWGYHGKFPGLYVGYDKPITWDSEAGMWYAPADYD